jgi:hypothetical protein
VDETIVPESLDKEFYRTDERAGYPPFVWWLRRTVKRYVPAGKRAKELIDHVLPKSLGRVPAPAEPGATANDSCAGSLSVTTSGVVNTNVPGSYTLTYVATDPAGNSKTNNRTVNVVP